MNKVYEVMGFVGIALTVIGQILCVESALMGQTMWMIANVLYLTKAVKQKMGKAEIVRNVVMSAVTCGLIVKILFF
jgi:hypothetical protein